MLNPSHYPDLQGKLAVITGAGANGGIGHALALGFAEAGARLALCDIDAKGLQQTASEVAPTPCLAEICDIASEEQVLTFFNRIEQQWEQVDVLVNVPFYFPKRVKPHELDKETWDQMFAVNVTGYFLCIRAALKIMLKQSSGSIINIGSNAGVTALGRGAFPYSCTKGAINQMTRELAVEYAANGIRTNAILPAQTITPGLEAHLGSEYFQKEVLPNIRRGLPMGELLQPQDYVGPALFLASATSRAVNGVLLPVDQGNTALNAGGSHNWWP